MSEIHKEITLKQLMKASPRYIRITRDGLLAHKEDTIRYKGKPILIDVWYHVKLPIEIYSMDRKDKPRNIHLHYGDAYTLLTLLAHYPPKLEVEYWHNNSCDLLKEKGLKMETVTVIGKKGKKKFKVKINNIYKDPIQMIAKF